jgi:CRP-like cAMP-binding protein
MLTVEVDGTPLAEVGPGAVLGERAILEGGRRTATLTAVTDCTVAVADRAAIDVPSLEHLTGGHRREEG